MRQKLWFRFWGQFRYQVYNQVRYRVWDRVYGQVCVHPKETKV